ncbi:MAG: ATP-binding protein [Melioribacteraceae bacterium]
MQPLSASIIFSFLGLVFILISLKVRVKYLIEFLLISTFTLVIIIVTGQLTNLYTIGTIGEFIYETSILLSISIIIIIIGIYYLHFSGKAFTVEQKVFFIITPIFVFTVYIFFILVALFNTIKETTNLINHTHQVINEIKDLEHNLDHAQLLLKSYILTGEKNYLEKYSYNLDSTSSAINELKKLTSDNPIQQSLIERLRNYFITTTKLSYALNETKDSEINLIEESINKLTDSVRACSNQLLINEENLIKSRQNLEANKISKTKTIITLIFIPQISLLVIIFFIVKYGLEERRKAEEKLTKYSEDLDIRVKEKTKLLSESEEKFKRLFHSVPVEMALLNTEGIFIDINNTWCESYGFTKEEVIGKTSFEIGIIDKKNYEKLQDTIKAKGYVENLELNLKTKEGKKVVILLSNKKVKIGEEEFYISSGIDITKKKQEEQTNLNKAKVLNALIRGEELNSILELIVRLVEEEDSTKICSILLLDEDRKHFRIGAAPNIPDFYKEIIEKEEIKENAGSSGAAVFSKKRIIVDDIMTHPLWIPYKGIAKNANFRSCWSEPIMDDKGNVVAIFEIYHHEPKVPTEEELKLIESISDLIGIAIIYKKNEESLKKFYEELEQKVKDRTQQLMELNKELEAFSYTVSHDLRAPLRHLNGFIELLKNSLKTSDEKIIRYINIISEASKKMGQLIDDLLAFSRIGRTELKRTEVDINSIINEVRIELENETANRKIEWKISNMPKVIADYALLRQVWTNLLSNSIKYTSKCEEAVIEVSCKEMDDYYEFSVKDNGAGFDMDYKDKLFGVFQRLHNVSDYSGTGIGLSIVKRIINKHGGKIWAEGEVNKGATFYFTLPK